MANSSNMSFMSIGSQSKPPTLVREEFQQWKIRMVNFLEGIHPRITEFLHNPPFIPVTLIPRVPATAITPEDEEEKELASLAPKCKRLLIMALPNDIFMSLDHCLEGGIASLKNNITICINEYLITPKLYMFYSHQFLTFIFILRTAFLLPKTDDFLQKADLQQIRKRNIQERSPEAGFVTLVPRRV
ncbi:hypothetical protein OSB04_029015 [Centaurea solstitialis]|uniref:Uncharacterized protein n=1 Tax=Centaurea solstitialis TaxID=347529 RepID=A0AA38W9V9_9ASTR|nr:hypothetical protein OSB04_029015 [Centaurea solstitialis]